MSTLVISILRQFRYYSGDSLHSIFRPLLLYDNYTITIQLVFDPEKHIIIDGTSTYKTNIGFGG